jgi:hypothetical protein
LSSFATLSITTFRILTLSIECHDYLNVMLSVVIQSVVLLNVAMLSIVILNVVVPSIVERLKCTKLNVQSKFSYLPLINIEN